MVGAVGASGGVNYTTEGSTRHTMSSEQKSKVESILSKYDSNSISQEDAKAISNSFKEAGIRPSSDLRQTIEDAGFDADEIRNLSSAEGVQGTQGKQPPPPPPRPAQNSEEESILSEILSTLLEIDSEDEDEQSLSQLEQLTDYTSRIMSLNDNAKDQVKELFEKYEPGSNTEYSKEEISNIITGSLNHILGDSSSYKESTSFYA